MKMVKSPPKGRKRCGKGEIAISSFPTVFSKELYCRHIKPKACLGKGSEKVF